MIFLSDKYTELCVICKKDTHIATSVPVEERTGYVEGAGQCCAACARLVRHG